MLSTKPTGRFRVRVPDQWLCVFDRFRSPGNTGFYDVETRKESLTSRLDRLAHKKVNMIRMNWRGKRLTRGWGYVPAHN